MKIFYKTSATATGGRSGTSQLDDGSFQVTMVPPASKDDGVNPEQLFALGYAACFDNAMVLTAQRMKLSLSSCKTTVEVGIGQLASGGYGLDIDLHAEIAGLPEADAQALLDATHKTCPYSNAVHGNIETRLHLKSTH
jgi:osmotically inducible protein OsmC